MALMKTIASLQRCCSPVPRPPCSGLSKIQPSLFCVGSFILLALSHATSTSLLSTPIPSSPLWRLPKACPVVFEALSYYLQHSHEAPWHFMGFRTGRQATTSTFCPLTALLLHSISAPWGPVYGPFASTAAFYPVLFCSNSLGFLTTLARCPPLSLS